MFYIVSFDGCGLESPLRSASAVSALALAQEAERNGCENVLIRVPEGEMIGLRQFAAQFGQPPIPEGPNGLRR